MSLITPDDVSPLVDTDLTDDQLQDVIDREEAELAGVIGQLEGERTEVLLLTSNLSKNRVTIRRPTDSVEVTDNGDAVDADDVRILADGRTLLRLASTGYDYGYWTGPLEVTYEPNDVARVKRVLIELTSLGIGAAGSAGTGELTGETIGSYSYRAGSITGSTGKTLTPEQRRRALVASLLPRTGPTSVRLGSSVIGRRPLLGTVRPA